jgi:hypothetical protein
MPPASADACQRIDPSNLDANEDSGATAVAIVAPDAVSRVWSPALDEFIASSCGESAFDFRGSPARGRQKSRRRARIRPRLLERSPTPFAYPPSLTETTLHRT